MVRASKRLKNKKPKKGSKKKESTSNPCPYQSKGCQEKLSPSRLEQHAKVCVYQKIDCTIQSTCTADITVKGLPQHMEDDHGLMPILGGGQHVVFIQVDLEDVQDVPPQERACCFPVYCQYDREHFFYLHLSRFKSGQWIAYVYGNGTREDGFVATVEAATNKNQVMLSYKGPVNPFNMSHWLDSEGENIFGLTINNTVMREELIHTEGGGDKGMVEIRIKVENVDAEVNRKAEEEIKEVQAQQEAEQPEAEPPEAKLLEAEPLMGEPMDPELLKLLGVEPLEAELSEAEQQEEENDIEWEEEEESPSMKRFRQETKLMCVINNCGEFFNNGDALKDHIADYHLSKPMLPILMPRWDSPLICPVPDCRKPYPGVISLRRHYAIEHNKIDDYCSQEEQQGVWVTSSD